MSTKNLSKIHWIGQEEDQNVLRVCSETNQGMRKYMEDEVSVVIGDGDSRSAFLGVFDGHGGKEASIYARDNLFSNITQQSGFTSDDPEKVKAAIREGFIKTHWDMFRVVETWPKRKDGQNSTSGTTATIAVIRGNKLYMAHVGDSAAVIATKENNKYISTDLTKDHKPESIDEKSRIENLGGYVANSNGVPRVVWKRAVKRASPVNGEAITRYEYVPFLAVSRALGDLWSYNSESKEFIVSPEPEVRHIDLIPGFHKFLVLASDGLWGVMNGQEAVDTIAGFETDSHHAVLKRNCSNNLINKCLSLWQKKRSRADNISSIVVFFDNELAVLQDGPSDEDAETDCVVTDAEDDDTPPLTRTNSSVAMVRSLAFNALSPVMNNFTVTVKKLTSDNSSSSSSSSSSGVDNNKLEPPASNTITSEISHKRKHGENSSSLSTSQSPVCHQKKIKIVSSPVVDGIIEDSSHQCNVVTVLSPESLCDLQLDEDLGFAADDESDLKSRHLRLSTTKKSHRFNQQHQQKLSPVVQG